jgi:hypothetical protein
VEKSYGLQSKSQGTFSGQKAGKTKRLACKYLEKKFSWKNHRNPLDNRPLGMYHLYAKCLRANSQRANQ